MHARSLRDQADPMPLYGRIAAVLRSQILDGTLSAGDSLPPIEELCGTFGVARVTVRQAIQLLADEGLLISRRGVRVTVAGGGRVRARETLYQTVDAMSVLAPGHVIEVQERTIVTELPAGACFVGTPAASYVRYRKTQREDRTRYASMTIFVAETVAALFPSGAETREKLGPLVKRYCDPPLAFGRERIMVAAADYRDAGALDYPVAAPVARVHRVFCDAADRAVYVSFSTYRGDRWGIEQETGPYARHGWEFPPAP
jgi:GntR family transcriptional regulator